MNVCISQAITGALRILRCFNGIVDDGRCDYSILSDRYNTANLLLLITINNQVFVAKCAAVGSHAACRLEPEIRWYEELQLSGCATVYRHFPKYFGSCISGDALVMLIEHIPQVKTMRDAFLNGNIAVDDAIQCLREVFCMFGLRVGCYSTVEQACLQNGLYDRLNARVGLLRRLITENHSEANLWERKVSVNGLPQTSLAMVTNWLLQMNRSLIQSSPALVGATHGDLHLENILVNSGNQFYLIDPNASVGPIPIYDIGKLFHSTYGMYDLIHTGNVKLNVLSSLEMDLCFSPIPYQHYRELHEKFKLLLKNVAQDEKIFENLYTQASIMCLSHFMCLLPHHFGNRTIFLALVARTIELFHKTKLELLATRYTSLLSSKLT